MKSMPNRLLLIVIGLISAVAVALVLFSSDRSATTYEANTPEWAVQQFLTAMVSQNTDTAFEYISPSSPCKIVHLDRAWMDRDLNVDLVQSTISGDSARVEVDIEYSNSDLFGSPYVESHVYRLENTGSKWLIVGIPWPLYDCGEMSK
jgi:hypothetical protein